MVAPAETVIPLRFAAGVCHFGEGDPGWTLLQSGGSEEIQYFEGFIEFEEPFRVTPMVHVGLAGFDIDHRDNARLSVHLSTCDSNGFRVRIGTWLHTRIWSVEVSWLAIGH